MTQQSNVYYHVSPSLLGKGSIILPGNFGRVIDAYRPNSLGPLAVRELAFEVVRLRHFPDRPSRLTSLFLFPTLEHAFAQIHRFDFSCLAYKVELIEPEKGLFHGDMGLIHAGFPNDQVAAIPYLATLASAYFVGLQEICADSEYLTSSSVRILELCDHRVAPGQPAG